MKNNWIKDWKGKWYNTRYIREFYVRVIGEDLFDISFKLDNNFEAHLSGCFETREKAQEALDYRMEKC